MLSMKAERLNISSFDSDPPGSASQDLHGIEVNMGGDVDKHIARYRPKSTPPVGPS